MYVFKNNVKTLSNFVFDMKRKEKSISHSFWQAEKFQKSFVSIDRLNLNFKIQNGYLHKIIYT